MAKFEQEYEPRVIYDPGNYFRVEIQRFPVNGEPRCYISVSFGGLSEICQHGDIQQAKAEAMKMVKARLRAALDELEKP